MKKFFSMLLAGALIAGLITTVAAQGAGPKGGQKPGVGPGGPGGRGPGGPGGQGGQGRGRMMAGLMDKIKPPLTADQKTKLKAVSDKMREEFRKLREAPGDMQSKRPKMEALRKQQQDAFNKILTKPQQESLKKLMEEMRKQFMQGRGPGGPGGPPAGGKPPKGNKPPL